MDHSRRVNILDIPPDDELQRRSWQVVEVLENLAGYSARAPQATLLL